MQNLCRVSLASSDTYRRSHSSSAVSGTNIGLVLLNAHCDGDRFPRAGRLIPVARPNDIRVRSFLVRARGILLNERLRVHFPYASND
jgi:hypothetical protein